MESDRLSPCLLAACVATAVELFDVEVGLALVEELFAVFISVVEDVESDEVIKEGRETAVSLELFAVFTGVVGFAIGESVVVVDPAATVVAVDGVAISAPTLKLLRYTLAENSRFPQPRR